MREYFFLTTTYPDNRTATAWSLDIRPLLETAADLTKFSPQGSTHLLFSAWGDTPEQAQHSPLRTEIGTYSGVDTPHSPGVE